MQISEESFTVIIKETKAVVLSAVKKHLFDIYAHALDDVVQETYFKAYDSLVKGKFKEESALSTWLYVIAKNEALRMNGKLKREEQKRNLFGGFFKESEKLTEDNLKTLEFQDILEKVKQLPLRYRSILILHSEGLNEKEIAEKLVLPAGTVKSRIHRGRKMMLRILESEGGTA